MLKDDVFRPVEDGDISRYKTPAGSDLDAISMAVSMSRLGKDGISNTPINALVADPYSLLDKYKKLTVLVKMLETLCHENKYEEAIACADKILTIDPHICPAWSAKCMIHLVQQDWRSFREEAIKGIKVLSGQDLESFKDLIYNHFHASICGYIKATLPVAERWRIDGVGEQVNRVEPYILRITDCILGMREVFDRTPELHFMKLREASEGDHEDIDEIIDRMISLANEYITAGTTGLSRMMVDPFAKRNATFRKNKKNLAKKMLMILLETVEEKKQKLKICKMLAILCGDADYVSELPNIYIRQEREDVNITK